MNCFHDFRELFINLVTRKPGDWNEVDVEHRFSDKQLDALRLLPRLTQKNTMDYGPYDSISENLAMLDADQAELADISIGPAQNLGMPNPNHIDGTYTDPNYLEFILCLECMPEDRSCPFYRFFYVNTKGYNYCRYVFEIDPNWVSVL